MLCAIEDFAGATAVQNGFHLFAGQGHAADRGHGWGRDADILEILLELLVQVHRLAGIGLNIENVARGFAVLFDGFDADDLGRALLSQRCVSTGAIRFRSFVAELNVTLAAILVAFGVLDIAVGAGGGRKEDGRKGCGQSGQEHAVFHHFGPLTAPASQL